MSRLTSASPSSITYKKGATADQTDSILVKNGQAVAVQMVENCDAERHIRLMTQVFVLSFNSASAVFAIINKFLSRYKTSFHAGDRTEHAPVIQQNMNLVAVHGRHPSLERC